MLTRKNRRFDPKFLGLVSLLSLAVAFLVSQFFHGELQFASATLRIGHRAEPNGGGRNEAGLSLLEEPAALAARLNALADLKPEMGIRVTSTEPDLITVSGQTVAETDAVGELKEFLTPVILEHHRLAEKNRAAIRRQLATLSKKIQTSENILSKIPPTLVRTPDRLALVLNTERDKSERAELLSRAEKAPASDTEILSVSKPVSVSLRRVAFALLFFISSLACATFLLLADRFRGPLPLDASSPG